MSTVEVNDLGQLVEQIAFSGQVYFHQDKVEQVWEEDDLTAKVEYSLTLCITKITMPDGEVHEL